MTSILPSKSFIFFLYFHLQNFVFFIFSLTFSNLLLLSWYLTRELLTSFQNFWCIKLFLRRPLKKMKNFKNLIEKSSPTQNPYQILTILPIENKIGGFKSWMVLCQTPRWSNELHWSELILVNEVHMCFQYLTRAPAGARAGGARS